MIADIAFSFPGSTVTEGKKTSPVCDNCQAEVSILLAIAATQGTYKLCPACYMEHERRCLLCDKTGVMFVIDNERICHPCLKKNCVMIVTYKMISKLGKYEGPIRDFNSECMKHYGKLIQALPDWPKKQIASRLKLHAEDLFKAGIVTQFYLHRNLSHVRMHRVDVDPGPIRKPEPKPTKRKKSKGK